MIPPQTFSRSATATPTFVSETHVSAPERTNPHNQRPPAVRWSGLAVFALLALYATTAWTAALSKGISFDEGLQLAAGYNIWVNDDFRIEGANGDFTKRWATLPYLISKPHFVARDDSFWRQGAPYELAYRFFFQIGNRPESLLQQGRAMIALLGIATGFLVYWCSREIFGVAGGLTSLAIFTFSPHMLAFGGIVSTDMSIILTLFGGTWCIWTLLHELRLARLLLSLVFLRSWFWPNRRRS